MSRTVDELRALQANWDGYGAEAPNEVALAWLLDVIYAAGDFAPERLVPSAEGGAAAVWWAESCGYADIECFNDGEALACIHRMAGAPEIWMIDARSHLAETIARIKAFMAAPQEE